MLNTDEDALICDLAETYGIFQMKRLPLTLVATLSCGLRQDSRIMMILSGMKITTDQLLMAIIADDMNFLAWAQTESARTGENKPKSIVNLLMEKEYDSSVQTYSTGGDFSETRHEILSNIKKKR